MAAPEPKLSQQQKSKAFDAWFASLVRHVKLEDCRLIERLGRTDHGGLLFTDKEEVPRLEAGEIVGEDVAGFLGAGGRVDATPARAEEFVIAARRQARRIVGLAGRRFMRHLQRSDGT